MFKILLPRLILFCGLASIPALAQTCIYNFSYYTDGYGSSDGLTLYASVSVTDYSNCNHSQYATTATLRAPSGRTSQTQQSGLSSTTALDVNSETGTFQASTNGSYYCPAFHGFAGFGDGWDIYLAIAHTYFTNAFKFGTACAYATQACLPGTTPTCPNGVAVPGYMDCPKYALGNFLKIVVNGRSQCIAPAGLATAATGPGPCD